MTDSTAPTTKRLNWFQRNSKKTVFTLFGVLIVGSLGIIELIPYKKTPIQRSIRLREHPPLRNEITVPNIEQLERTLFTAIDNLEIKRYVFRTDEQGFIMPSKVHDQPDLSVVFLGGSTTECLWVDEENRFPYRAGALLGEKLKRKINSYNSGVAGNNSLHGVNLLLNKIIPMRPNMVVFMDNANDLNILLFSKSYWNNNPNRSQIVVYDPDKDAFRRLLITVRDLFPSLGYRLQDIASDLFQRRIDEFAQERTASKANLNKRRGDAVTMSELNEAVLVGEFEANLKNFVEICQTRRIMPVLMTQFNRFKEPPDETVRESMLILESGWGIDYPTYKRLTELFSETIRRVARTNGVFLIDLEAMVPKEKTYIYDLLHLTNEGSKLVSEIVADQLAASPEVRSLPTETSSLEIR